MAPVLQAELVVADLPKDVPVTLRDEVMSLIDTTVPGQRENALFGKQVVEFESTHLHVEPGAVSDVIEAHKDLLKVKSARIIGRRKQVERDVLFERSAGMEVEAAQVKARTGDSLDRLTAVEPSRGVGVHLDLAGAHAVPDRGDAEDDRPVGRVLPDR